MDKNNLFPKFPVGMERELPVLALAYLGDAVFELYVRGFLVRFGLVKVKDLHRAAVGYVNAAKQAEILRRLEPELTPEELSVMRRGRNAKSGRAPKNQDVLTYRQSTAFETLIGFLYASGQYERLGCLWQVIERLLLNLELEDKIKEVGEGFEEI